VAPPPTIFVVASDEHRNGKTLLARCVADYLMLDRRDPFLLDTDAPDGTLRNYFPGRTQLLNFAKVQGQIKVFDAILASPGRDYVIDLTAKHTTDFLTAVRELGFFREAKALGFRIIVLFIVDQTDASRALAVDLGKSPDIDLLVPVVSEFVGSKWPLEKEAFTIPVLGHDAWLAIAHKRFSFRAFVLGDTQNLSHEVVKHINRFVYAMMRALSNIEIDMSLKGLRS
jgi:hypothetical protein